MFFIYYCMFFFVICFDSVKKDILPFLFFKDFIGLLRCVSFLYLYFCLYFRLPRTQIVWGVGERGGEEEGEQHFHGKTNMEENRPHAHFPNQFLALSLDLQLEVTSKDSEMLLLRCHPPRQGIR